MRKSSLGTVTDPSAPRGPRDLAAITKRVAAAASARGGVISGRELVALGLSRRSIRDHERRGWLHRLGGDVWAVGHVALPERGWRWAALLSAGDGAALSYWTAAVVWGLLERDPEPNTLHVSTCRSDRVGCRHARVHRPRVLSATDCTVRHGYRVTGLFRTLLDLAGVANHAILMQLVEAAHTKHAVDLAALAKYARQHRRPGARRLREAATAVAGPVRLRSNLEAMFRALAREAGLPEFEMNVPFDGQELDVLWRFRNAAIELDWWTTHGGRGAYRRDHRKARKLARLGVALLTIAGEDLEDDPEGVLADIRAFLSHHPPGQVPLIPA